MAFKNYKVTSGTADTFVDLIPALSGKEVIILSLEVIAPTAAITEIKRNDGTSDYAAVSIEIAVDKDTAVLDHKIIIPNGHKVSVKSNQVDTQFVANVNEETVA